MLYNKISLDDILAEFRAFTYGQNKEATAPRKLLNEIAVFQFDEFIRSGAPIPIYRKELNNLSAKRVYLISMIRGAKKWNSQNLGFADGIL